MPHQDGVHLRNNLQAIEGLIQGLVGENVAAFARHGNATLDAGWLAAVALICFGWTDGPLHDRVHNACSAIGRVKRYEVHVLPRALREMAAVFAWWRIHRPAARRLVANEIRRAKTLLTRFPEAGEVDRGRGGEIRRLLIGRSGYFLFYRVDHEARRVEVLALWNAQRLPPAL